MLQIIKRTDLRDKEVTMAYSELIKNFENIRFYMKDFYIYGFKSRVLYGFANAYELDMTGLNVLNLNNDKYSILNWLAILTNYRTYWQQKSIAEREKDYLCKNFLIDISDYDVVMGYRADDSYFAFAQDFVSNLITIKQLSEAMHLGKLGEQIVIKSQKAFDRLKFIEAKSAEKYPETNLKRLRTSASMSQSELAQSSGVSLRQIQLFEQRERDINKTQAQTLLKLAKALSCKIEQLLEHRIEEDK